MKVDSIGKKLNHVQDCECWLSW